MSSIGPSAVNNLGIADQIISAVEPNLSCSQAQGGVEAPAPIVVARELLIAGGRELRTLFSLNPLMVFETMETKGS